MSSGSADSGLGFTARRHVHPDGGQSGHDRCGDLAGERRLEVRAVDRCQDGLRPVVGEGDGAVEAPQPEPDDGAGVDGEVSGPLELLALAGREPPLQLTAGERGRDGHLLDDGRRVAALLDPTPDGVPLDVRRQHEPQRHDGQQARGREPPEQA